MRRDRQAGLTLVEVLVVLSILGVMAGVTAMSLAGADRSAEAGIEAERLASRLRLAADDALVTGRSVIFRWDREGYAFFTPAGAGEDPVAHPAALLGARHEMPGRLELRVEGAAEALSISPGASGEAARFEIRAPDGDGNGGWQVAFDGFAPSVERLVR